MIFRFLAIAMSLFAPVLGFVLMGVRGALFSVYAYFTGLFFYCVYLDGLKDLCREEEEKDV